MNSEIIKEASTPTAVRARWKEFPPLDTLPQRLLKEEANSGPAQGRVSELDKMLPEYYELRGWTPDGSVTPQIRERLGLPSQGGA